MPKPNFTPREEVVGPYTVRFVVSGVALMTTAFNPETHQYGTREEPAMWAYIYKDSRMIAKSSLNSATLCQEGYNVRGVEATAAEIVHAILGDEDIFTGAPSFPDEQDNLAPERNVMSDLPEAVPFDTYTVSEMFDHLAKHHQTYPLKKTRKDRLAAIHTGITSSVGRTGQHEGYGDKDHIHMAAVGGALVANVANPISSSSRSALKQLVDNDFKALAAEMEQTASDIRLARVTAVRLKFLEREKEAKTFQRKGQVAVSRFQTTMRTLMDDAKVKDLIVSMPSIGYSHQVTAQSRGLSTALNEANAEVDREVGRAMLTLERERLRAQRQVLLAGITQEALDLLDTIPTAQQLMMDAAATKQPMAITAQSDDDFEYED